jgi:predicted dehydrogenase
MNAVEEDRFEVYGQAGKLTVDRYHSLRAEMVEPTRELSRLKKMSREAWWFARSPSLWFKLFAPHREPSYRVALARFVDAVQTNRPVSPDFWDGFRSLAVIEAAEVSARTRRPAVLSGVIGEDFARQ